MKMITRLLLSAIVVLTLTGYHNFGFASVVLHDPTWEAPGGHTESYTGTSTAHDGGYTIHYTNFDSSAYNELYYVVGDYAFPQGPNWIFTPEGPYIATIYGGGGRLQTHDSMNDYSNGSVWWGGSLSINYFDGYYWGYKTYDALFCLTIYDTSGNPLSLIDASEISGMDERVGGALLVTGDFYADWEFVLSAGPFNPYYPAMTVFDSLQTNPSDVLKTSVTRAFYFSAVPIPSAIWLLGSGLIGIVGIRRKFKN